MGDFSLVNFVTLLASFVTILGGVATTARFVQQLRSTSHTQAPPSVQQPVTVPQRTQPDTSPQAVQSATVARPNLPPPQPTPTPYQPAPSVPYYPPAPNLPYRPYPGILPAPSTVSGAQPQGGHKRPASFLVIALGGFVTQVLWVVVMILVGLPNYAWKNDPTVSMWYDIVLFPTLILNIAFLVYAVVKASQLRRWGWLIEAVVGTAAGLLAFSGVALIIFGLLVPTHRREQSG
jgi:hypothetical protein